MNRTLWGGAATISRLNKWPRTHQVLRELRGLVAVQLLQLHHKGCSGARERQHSSAPPTHTAETRRCPARCRHSARPAVRSPTQQTASNVEPKASRARSRKPRDADSAPTSPAATARRRRRSACTASQSVGARSCEARAATNLIRSPQYTKRRNSAKARSLTVSRSLSRLQWRSLGTRAYTMLRCAVSARLSWCSESAGSPYNSLASGTQPANGTEASAPHRRPQCAAPRSAAPACLPCTWCCAAANAAWSRATSSRPGQNSRALNDTAHTSARCYQVVEQVVVDVATAKEDYAALILDDGEEGARTPRVSVALIMPDAVLRHGGTSTPQHHGGTSK